MAFQSERLGGSLTVSPAEFPDPAIDIPTSDAAGGQVATLAGGCFWCVEAVFKALDGVLEVTSGYAGDTAETADYRTVCSGSTEHAEVVEISFDPRRITYGQLLKVFFSVAHNPTQLDRQGADVGRQYRSAIFYADARQKQVAEAYIEQLNEAGALHVAQSQYHDIGVAQALGFATCWIERRQSGEGFGATPAPDRATAPDWHFSQLSQLADAVERERSD